MPNNHLITLRRFAIPVGDNIYHNLRATDSDKNMNSGPDIGRMLCYFGGEDNKLEDILSFSFNSLEIIIEDFCGLFFTVNLSVTLQPHKFILTNNVSIPKHIFLIFIICTIFSYSSPARTTLFAFSISSVTHTII